MRIYYWGQWNRVDIYYLVKKFLPNWFQWSLKTSSTLIFFLARIWSQASAAQMPSFSLMWLEPVRKLSLL